MGVGVGHVRQRHLESPLRLKSLPDELPSIPPVSVEVFVVMFWPFSAATEVPPYAAPLRDWLSVTADDQERAETYFSPLSRYGALEACGKTPVVPQNRRPGDVMRW